MTVQPTPDYRPAGLKDRLVIVGARLLLALLSVRFRSRAMAETLTLLDRLAGADAKAGRAQVTVLGHVPAQTCRFCGEAIRQDTSVTGLWASTRSSTYCPLAPTRGGHAPLVVPAQRRP